MATVITSECINCGACEPECPNTAIYQGGVEWQAPDGSMHAAISNDIFYIVPEKCTECVGFYDQEACAKVCPVDCCVPDPALPESEAVLLERARALHPDKTIPDDAPSRFKKEGVGAPAAPATERIDAPIADRRFFNPQLATAANVFLNLVLYPVVVLALAVSAGRVDLFSLGVHKWIFLGLALAFAEAAFRMRESLFGGVPFGEAPVRGALYAPLVWPLGRLVVLLAGARGAGSGVGFDGFYGGKAHFDEKLERERRYGSIYKIVDRDDAYILRLEFPRRLPPSSLADELGLPPEMPDYDYELSLQDGTFVVHGRVVDPQVRKLTSVAPAFPPEFTTRVSLRDPVAGFRHRYRDKTLEVILPKAGG